MNRNSLLKKVISYPYRLLTVRQSSSQVNLEKLEQDAIVDTVADDDAVLKEEEIQRKRDKSRLRSQDRSVVNDINPYPEPKFWHHSTVKYLRRSYGRYGSQSGVDPAICWPTKVELQDYKLYEQVAFPYAVHEVVAAAKSRREEKNMNTKLRQEAIVKKVAKLEDMKQDLFKRIAKKEAEVLAAKERKERLVEEVRRHFGYSVDPRDDKFKEMLEKKEKEQRKQMKEARRKEKEAVVVSTLLKKKNAPEKTDEVEEKNN